MRRQNNEGRALDGQCGVHFLLLHASDALPMVVMETEIMSFPVADTGLSKRGVKWRGQGHPSECYWV